MKYDPEGALKPFSPVPSQVQLVLWDIGVIYVLYMCWPSMFLILISIGDLFDRTENEIVMELFDGFG